MSWKLFRALRHPSLATIPVLPAGLHFLETNTGISYYSDGTRWIPLSSPPIGATYTQYPAASSNDDATEFPVSERPATLFGGTWAEQWPTESVYFRTRGALSDASRVNGKQEDAIKEHKHPTYDGLNGTALIAGDSGAGFQYSNYRVLRDLASFNTGLHSGATTETRTVNRRVKVWKRIA